MADTVNLKAYFDRIGFAGSIAPTLQTLEALHALHPAIIPFENLSPLLGDAVALDQSALEKKLLSEKRGGFCFEHNTLFARVLEDLDFVVRPLLARVLWNNPESDRPASHMLLLVEVNGQNYIADVGFGGLTLTAPLRLRADVEQQTPHEAFVLTQTDGVWTLAAKLGADLRPLYAFTLDTVEVAQIEALCRDIASNPASPFTQELRVALAPAGKRLKLHNTHYTVQPLGEEASKTEIESFEQLRDCLAQEFGLTLPPAERIEPVLLRFAPHAPSTEADPTEA